MSKYIQAYDRKSKWDAKYQDEHLNIFAIMDAFI